MEYCTSSSRSGVSVLEDLNRKVLSPDCCHNRCLGVVAAAAAVVVVVVVVVAAISKIIS